VKNNLGPDSTGLAYRVIQASNGAPLADWEPEPVTETADEAMRPAGSDEERAPLEEAKAFLWEVLAFGPLPVPRIEKDARGAGHSPATIRRAKKALGIEAYRDGFGPGGKWHWRLPATAASGGTIDAQEPIDAHPNGVSAYEGREHLWEEGAL
jgi:putative DNA primase/helicase